ncbi:helix-turn-helix domain-containing protein [Nonomuraea sp. CA-141351]|uniref:helix-turn-helix domain-containing protein n=1 Tax=Nonomuraea sp. CA-141351 TaxID=3239996 RepID=UPI003D91075A
MTKQIPHNDAVHVAFHRAGAVGQSEPSFDRRPISTQPGGEVAQFPRGAGLRSRRPVFQVLLAAAVDEHFGELACVMSVLSGDSSSLRSSRRKCARRCLISSASTLGPANPSRVARERREAYVRGFQLGEIRQAAGVTQAELAHTLGVSQARISKIEHGEVSGIDVVREYIAALGGRLDLVATLGDRTWKVA